MPDFQNIRTMTITTGSGKDVKDTNQLKGEAKDSLSGKNETKEYTTSGSPTGGGPWGGLPNRGKS